MNILTVCQHGNVRSVGTRSILTKLGHRDVIAIGAENTTPETLEMLYDWAELVLVAEPQFAEFLPDDEKVDKNFTIGPDTFGWYGKKELRHIIEEQLKGVDL